MKIELQVQRKYSKEILKTVQASETPLAISQVLEKLHAADDKLGRDVALALVWHLLSTHQLQFDSARRLEAPTKAQTATQQRSRLMPA